MITTKWEETTASQGWLIRHNLEPSGFVPNYNQAQFKIEGDLITKRISKLVDQFNYSIWRSHLERILKIWPLPDFSFTEAGYQTQFIKGQDLHGNNVLEYDGILSGVVYDDRYSASIQDIYHKVDQLDRELGFTFTDVNESNILLDPQSDRAFLVDFDNIGKLQSDSITNKHRGRILKWK